MRLVFHHNPVARTSRNLVACGVVVHQHRAVQGHPLGHVQEHAVLGVGCMHRAHPFTAMVPAPIEVGQVALFHSLAPRHAHHAFSHGQVARLGHHVPVDQDNAVGVQPRNRVGLHVGRPALRGLGCAHRTGQHGRDGAVLPAFRLPGWHRQCTHALLPFLGQKSRSALGHLDVRHEVLGCRGLRHHTAGSLIQSYPFSSSSRASSLGPDFTICPSLNTCTKSGTMWSNKRW